ncbi:Lipoprotein signal peptidase [Enhygromyxa salina]|uniref:Lipoprotein signal peptidase n=1 Tax=Enhygromyxa salina TaxID=215803 RepID=A0A0C2D021_9BACT|nr:signal peptidase II [Enhygromyxa salina]KIG16581.1 Lipoprotein signal peptidase [Enhygromyxa salina]
MSPDKPQPPEPSRNSRLLVVAIVFAVAIGLDLWSKAWAWEHLKDGPSVEVIEHFFYLKFGFNTGSAFSFLRDESWARYFFITVTFLALGYMGWLAWKMPTSRVYGFIAVGLIAAGAAGNLHDRFVRVMPVWMNGEFVERHGVIDFLQFYYPWKQDSYWPIFNVADTALVCGVALLLIFLHYHGAEGELADAKDGAPAKADGAAAEDEDEEEDEKSEAAESEEDEGELATPAPA